MTSGSADRIGAYLGREGVKDYQRHIFGEFHDIIATASVHFDANGRIEWDRRAEIKEKIEAISAAHGVGVAVLLLHAQQFITGHIPLEIRGQNLAKATERVRGKNGEQFLNVPARKYSANIEVLQELGIMYKYADRKRYVTHETDKKPCFYCSCGEMNPHEVVIDHKSRGLTDSYRLGFTFSPFGRPDQVVHFLAWNAPEEGSPVSNMTFSPGTYGDLVQLVIEVNKSIRGYFQPQGIRDFPVIDGVHNGWAGNTLYHNHFQFVCMENRIPITLNPTTWWEKRLKNGTVSISRINWPLPVYRIQGELSLQKEAGTEICIRWQSSSDAKCLYRELGGGVTPKETDYVHVRTANVLIPGNEMGHVGYFVPRDCRRVNAKKVVGGIPPKKSLGVLESLGSFIIDDEMLFRKIRDANEEDRSQLAMSWLLEVAPDEPVFFLEAL